MSRRAAELIKEGLLANSRPDALLRLAATVVSCGCINYDLRLEKTKVRDDITMTMHGLRIVMDSKTLEFIEDLRIDFVEDEEGPGIVFVNPNENHH